MGGSGQGEGSWLSSSLPALLSIACAFSCQAGMEGALQTDALSLAIHNA